jgi:hypothetical protein
LRHEQGSPRRVSYQALDNLGHAWDISASIGDAIEFSPHSKIPPD